MKYCLFLVLLISLAASAQNKPSQAEINKAKQMQQQMQKQLEEQLKELEKTDPNQAKMIRNMMKQGNISQTDSDETLLTYTTKPPVKDIARINSIPAQLFSNTQLIDFVKTMRVSLQQKLNPKQQNDFQTALSSLGNDAEKMEDAAIINWINKSPEGALLFAMKAVEANVDTPMYLNNLGALLVQCRKEEKAIPILLKVLQSYPQSAMILNNLGQAYLGLGDVPTAKDYFEKCLLLLPSHPEANHSMGLIYRFMGNTAKSDYYFEQELQVRFSHAVYDVLKSHNSKNLSNALRARWTTPPNYFEKLGLQAIKVPNQPRSLAESNTLYLAHKEFQKKMESEIGKLNQTDVEILSASLLKKAGGKNIHSDLIKVLLEDFQQVKDEQFKWINETSENGEYQYPTIGNPTTKHWQDMALDYRTKSGNFAAQERKEDSLAGEEYLRAINNYHGSREGAEQIEQRWKQKQIDIKIKYCRLQMALADEYLPKFADYQKTAFQEHLSVFPDLINEAFYYSSLTPDDPTALFEAHNLMKTYLQFLQAYSALTMIANTPQNNYQGQGDIHVGCDLDALLAEQIQINSVRDFTPNCPFKIVVPLVIAKASFDCKGAEVEGGEGVIVGASYEFKTGNTTLSIGAGIETSVPFVSAGAKQQVYVTFDGNGNYSDAGIKGEAGVEIGGYGPTVSSKAGYEIGINAGASASTEGAGNQMQIKF